jgi:large subunit ribosomal protein L10
MSVENFKHKQAVIDEIKDKLTNATSAVVIDYQGITVAEADAMRKKLREAGIDYKVYKNTLVNRAIADTNYSDLKSVLFGPSAFAFSYDDATAPARMLNGVMKEYKKMSFKAGIVEGVFYDAEGMQGVAEVLPREELLAKFLGSIQSPVSKFVRTLAAIAEAKSGDGAEASETEVASPEESKADETVTEAEAKPEVEAETKVETPVAEAEAKPETPAAEAGEAPVSEEPASETEETPGSAAADADDREQ